MNRNRIGSSLLIACFAALAIAPARGIQSSAEMPRYGDYFPAGTVDRYGFTSVDDFGPLKKHHQDAVAMVRAKRHKDAIDTLRPVVAKSKDDLLAYVILIRAADESNNLTRALGILREDRREQRAYNPKTKKWEPKPLSSSFRLACAYADMINVARQGRNSGVALDEIAGLTPKTRLEAMIQSSIVWCIGNARIRDARKIAYGYLTKDPDFYQLRTFYAHMWEYGSGPIQYGNGTVDNSAAAADDPAVVLKHANMVIKSNPEYIPVYFVARTSNDRAYVKRNLETFIKGCNPKSDWYKRAKTWLDRNK